MTLRHFKNAKLESASLRQKCPMRQPKEAALPWAVAILVLRANKNNILVLVRRTKIAATQGNALGWDNHDHAA